MSHQNQLSEIIAEAEDFIKMKIGLEVQLTLVPSSTEDQILYRFAREWGVTPSYIYGKAQNDEQEAMRQIIMLRMHQAGVGFNIIAHLMGEETPVIVKSIHKAGEMLRKGDDVLVNYYNHVKHLFDETL